MKDIVYGIVLVILVVASLIVWAALKDRKRINKERDGEKKTEEVKDRWPGA